MQNIIKIDVTTDTIISISTVDNGSNSIIITFTNCTVNDAPPEVEFYKPEKYCGCITFDTGQQEYTATVPDECINDGHVFHFRYVCKDKAHKYFHVLGDATKFENMTLEQLANDVVKMVGVPKVNDDPPPEPTPTYSGGTIQEIESGNDDTSLNYDETKCIGIVPIGVRYYVNENINTTNAVNDLILIKCIKNKIKVHSYSGADWSV